MSNRFSEVPAVRLARLEAASNRNPEAAAKALAYVRASLVSLVGFDDRESPLTLQIKSDAGEAVGELTQDSVLLVADLLEAIGVSIASGNPGAGLPAAVIGLFTSIPEIVADAREI